MLYLTTLLFLPQNTPVQHNFLPVFHRFHRFCTGFAPDFGKNRKKSANFLQFFLVVYQQVRRKLKK